MCGWVSFYTDDRLDLFTEVYTCLQMYCNVTNRMLFLLCEKLCLTRTIPEFSVFDMQSVLGTGCPGTYILAVHL